MNTVYYIDMNLTLNTERPSSNVKVASETVVRLENTFTYEIRYLKDTDWYSYSKTINVPCPTLRDEKMVLDLLWENGHPRMVLNGIPQEQPPQRGENNNENMR